MTALARCDEGLACPLKGALAESGPSCGALPLVFPVVFYGYTHTELTYLAPANPKLLILMP